MKTIITVTFCFLSLYLSTAQELSQEFKKGFDDELKVFTSNITFLNVQILASYSNFNTTVNRHTLRVMKSKRSYPSLIPMEAGIITKFVGLVPKMFLNPVAAKANPVAGLFIGLLNQGWKAHNQEVETRRKEALIDETIQIYLNNQIKEDEYQARMDIFLRRANQPSVFEERLTNTFYQSDSLKAEKIYNELFDLNRTIEKNNPIIANRKASAALTTQSLFYEDFINQFPRFHQNALLGTAGSLYGYLELSSSFKIKNKILVPDVPAGFEIGERFNSILPKVNKKPLELKVIKVLWIKSIKYRNGHKPEMGIWQLTLDKDNYIRRRFLTQMIANEPFLNPQPETEDKHAYEFLEKYGEYDKKIGLWKIPSSLFSEFTKKIPEGMNPPSGIRNMIEL